MFSLLGKNRLFSSSPSSKIRTLLIRFQVCEFSSSSFSHPQPYSLPQHHRKLEDELRVSVWWDFDNCAVPSDVSFSKVAISIMRAVRANGIKGPIHIDAYGDIYRLSEINQEELFSNGIDLHHIPGGKNNAQGYLMDWVSQIPPPAHLFLIFGDRDFHFAGLLNRLRMNNYNILLACPARPHVALCHAATIMWQWSSMLKGEDLTGKHFNHPPDGPFNSWYGNSNMPLENPFSAVDPPTSSQNVEIHKSYSDIKLGEVSKSDIKLGEVSKSASRQVMKILSSHPNGISIGDLRAELAKCDMPLGKNLYGHKKFSNFLVSIPNVQLQYPGEGKCCVRLIPSTTSTVNNKWRDGTVTQKLHNEGKNMDGNANGIPRISSLYQSSLGDDSKSFQSIPSQDKPIGEYVDSKPSFPSFKESNVHQPPDKLQKTSLGSEKVVDVASAPLPQIQLPPNLNDISINSDNGIVRSEDVSPEILEKKTTSQNPSTCNDGNANGIPRISSLYQSSLGDDSKSFQSIPSQDKPIGEYVDGKPSFPSFKESNVHQPPDKLQKTSLGSEKVVDVASAPLPQIQLPPNLNDISINSDNGIVRSEDVSPEILEKKTTSQNPSTCNDYTVLANNDIANCESGKADDIHENPARKEVDEVCCSQYSSPVGNSLVEKKRPDGSAETYSKSSTFFSWISSWWTFWKNGAKSDDLTAHQDKLVCEDSKLSELEQTASHFEEPKLSEPHLDVVHSGKPELNEKLPEPDQTTSHFEEPKLAEPHQDVIHSGKPGLFEDSKLSEVDQTASHFEEPKLSDVNHSGMPELFSTGSFWDDVESFVFTPRGSHLLSQSRSRKDLAHKLQKHGPLVLMSLTENDILQLVELLIAEKKWLEECPSKAFPFRLTQAAQKSSLVGQSHGTNGLRSLFLNKTPQPNLQKSFKHDVETDCQTIHQIRVSEPATETKCSERSRSYILADCQKLVREILRDYPGGFNMGCFRKKFVVTYGYHLDYKKLGYQKLASLLQIMPGVKLDSTYIYPSISSVCASDSETCIHKTQVTNGDFDSENQSSDSSPKDDTVESQWEELGPVSVKDPKQHDLESKLTQKAIELDTPKHHDYELVSDYDSSESEGDSSCLTQPEEQGKLKLKCTEKDSSFWEALDLWHISKEGENNGKKGDKGCDSSSSLLDILNSSTGTTQSTVSKVTSRNHREKQRSPKSYSFVADPALPDKDKFIGGILDGFKKDETKMQN